VKDDLAKAEPTARRGVDRSHFETVYAEHIGFAWRCLRALGVPPASLEDAAQEIFLTVHRRLPDFRGDSSLRTWIYGIIRNVAANHRRSQRRRGPHESLSFDLEYTGPSPLENLQVGEAGALIERFAAGLSDDKRELFVLALIEEMSMPEVAQALALPLNTAYARLRQVRLELRRAMQAQRGVP
jgi:RNA polymerase sigma-70 factor, ECF subfamily